MKKNNIKAFWLRLLALIISILPVGACVLLYFPIWKEVGSGALLSGFSLLLLLASAVPLFNYFKDRMKTPAAHTMWLISFLLFFTLSNIAKEMTVISFVGFISNLIGSFLFKAADLCEKKEEGKE